MKTDGHIWEMSETLSLKNNPILIREILDFPKLTPLIKSLDFEIDERESGQNHIKHIYIRNRK